MSQIQTQPLAGVAPTLQDKCCGQHDAFAILHDCHEHILDRLGRLEALGRDLKHAPAFEERHLAVLADVLTFLDTAIPIHSADEEQTLFPRLREALGSGGGHTPMDCMEQEHVQHRSLLAALKRAVVKRDAAATAQVALWIVDEYREHIGKEEQVLFPWARETLTDRAVVEAMTQQMHQRRVAAGMRSC